MTQTMSEGWIDGARTALEGQGRRPLIEFLQRQRWFSGKGRPVADVGVLDVIALPGPESRRLLVVVQVEYRGGNREHYTMPLVVRMANGADDVQALAAIPESVGEWLCDASADAETWKTLYDVVGHGRELTGQSGCLVGRPMANGRSELTGPVQHTKVLSAEQSNTSVVIDRKVILKLIRKVDSGINPDGEVLEFLTTQTSCRDVPALLGLMTYDADQSHEQSPATVAVLQRFVANRGDGWSHTLSHLEQAMNDPRRDAAEDGDPSKSVAAISGRFLAEIGQLGSITAGLHLALASRPDVEAFRPEPVTLEDVERWQSGMHKHVQAVRRDLHDLTPEQRSAAGLTGEEPAGWESACRERFADLHELVRRPAAKIRHHGDYHLGQVLKTSEGFVIIDFEGEPARSLDERRAKVCPLKDVGGMLRSFSYAAQTVLKRRGTDSAADGLWVRAWEAAARASFLDGYRARARPGEAVFLPSTWEEAQRVIRVYELDKTLYELRYELRNRPGWLPIPLAGIRAVLA